MSGFRAAVSTWRGVSLFHVLVATLFTIGAGVFLPDTAQSQSAEGGGIEIEAEGGIEWLRNEKLYIARGNAHATSGDLEVFAGLMKAHYRKGESGTEIHLIELEGDVRLETPGELIYGSYARYVPETERLEITGDNLRMESRDGDTKITARDKLEYHRIERRAIARGDAFARRNDTDVRADIISAFFGKDGEAEQASVERIEANGNVEIKTNGDFASSNEAVYFVKTEKATLTGNVMIKRGENQLRGEFAEIDLVTGRSRLTGGKDESGKPKRVQGLILPRAAVKDQGDESSQEGN